MTAAGPGTVLITGPTGSLGRVATLAMAGRPAAGRPDLLLVGRPGQNLTAVAAEARAAGATVHEIGCDLSRLADVSEPTSTIRPGAANEPSRSLISWAWAR